MVLDIHHKIEFSLHFPSTKIQRTEVILLQHFDQKTDTDLRPEFKPPTKIEMAFSQISDDDLTNVISAGRRILKWVK